RLLQFLHRNIDRDYLLALQPADRAAATAAQIEDETGSSEILDRDLLTLDLFGLGLGRLSGRHGREQLQTGSPSHASRIPDWRPRGPTSPPDPTVYFFAPARTESGHKRHPPRVIISQC